VKEVRLIIGVPAHDGTLIKKPESRTNKISVLIKQMIWFTRLWLLRAFTDDDKWCPVSWVSSAWARSVIKYLDLCPLQQLAVAALPSGYGPRASLHAQHSAVDWPRTSYALACGIVSRFDTTRNTFAGNSRYFPALIARNCAIPANHIEIGRRCSGWPSRSHRPLWARGSWFSLGPCGPLRTLRPRFSFRPCRTLRPLRSWLTSSESQRQRAHKQQCT
jgi:hypothetical protein